VAYQDKKVMILFSLYLGLASISVYRFIFNFTEVVYVENLDIYGVAGTVIIFPIVIFSMFVASYGLAKNKWDPKYIGFGASFFLMLFFIVDFSIDAGAFGWDIRFLVGDIYLIFFSIITLFATILFWKNINEKEIILPFFQNKATQFLFPCYIAIASISSSSIFSIISQITRGTNIEIYTFIALVLYIFVPIILIFSSKNLLENRTNTKFFALIGVLLFQVALFLDIYTRITLNLNLVYFLNRIVMNVFVIIVLILTIYYWKKMS